MSTVQKTVNTNPVVALLEQALEDLDGGLPEVGPVSMKEHESAWRVWSLITTAGRKTFPGTDNWGQARIWASDAAAWHFARAAGVPAISHWVPKSPRTVRSEIRAILEKAVREACT